MKTSQMNACLVLFLVAVGLHYSYGENALGENCTSSSDCDYSHARCVKYDQCEMGFCGCDYGYKTPESNIEGGYLCQKLKRIGERCDVITDVCYAGTCLGVCTCGKSLKPSEDRESCVGNSYSEPCDQGFVNGDWKTETCDANKGLRCDVDSKSCLCIYGMKRNGDHCEKYRLGETCDVSATTKVEDRKYCEDHLSCIEEKCACSDTTTEHTFKMRVNGEETEVRRCVDKDATLELGDSSVCIADYSKRYAEDEATVCGDYFMCGDCPEWANEYHNNTKCLSGGADSVRTNVMASLSLVLVAFVAMLH